jgi:hypothetical protein
MKRQKTDVRSMVYQYGTVPTRIAPVEGEEIALDQMRLGRRLWNVLVSISRVHTIRYRLIMRDELQEQIDQLRQRREALIQERKRLRNRARKRIPTPEIDEELKRISASLRMLLEQSEATKKQRQEARRPQLDALSALRFRRIKRARQAAVSLGLYWGTCNAIIQSADAAVKLGELQYRGFRGQGTVTTQIQGGAAIEKCVGGDHTFFQADEPTAGQHWRYARVRIGSQERAPRWFTIPIVYHRDIPDNASIKSVSATRRIVDGKPRCSLNITVNLPPVTLKTDGERIAIDIGYRLLPQGVRVAYWQDDSGQHGQVLVSHADISQFDLVSRQRSRADTERNRFLPQLVEFLASRELNEEWKSRTRFLPQWRSCDRLAALVRWWDDHRLAGDEEMHRTALQWRHHSVHLGNHWRNLQDQMVLRLREQYRIFAANIATRYGTLILEDFNLREVAEPKSDEPKKTAGATYRQMVSPSTFRNALINACQRHGVTIRKVPAEYTTAMCHACRTIEKWDQAASVMHRCANCGALWDQDQNAAINLLASGTVTAPGDEPDTPTIPPDPNKHLRLEEKGAMINSHSACSMA